MFRDPEEISAACGSYFLFSISNREHFDPPFQKIIDTKVCDILRDISSCLDRDSVNFSCAVIKNVLNQLKTKNGMRKGWNI